MGKMIRAITQDGGAVAYVVDSTDMIEQARRIHNMSATATAALGRTLTAASMLGITLKDMRSSITLRICGDGPAGKLLAVADANGNVRGRMENPAADLPLNQKGKLDVSGLTGRHGMLYVIKDLKMKEPYVGSVPLVSGEIAEDIAEYYANSEQIPTVCALGVLIETDLSVKAAGGYLIQLLPGAGEQMISLLENNVQSLRPISALLSEGYSPKQILAEVWKTIPFDLLDETEASYLCSCEQKKVDEVMMSLGRKELREMVAEEKDTELICEFCGKIYRYTPAMLQKLLEKTITSVL